MFVQSVLLLGLVAVVDAPVPSVREDRALAVWIAPQLIFHSFGSGRADLGGSDISALPLAAQLGWQIARRWLVSFSFGRLPGEASERTQATVGARWYLADGLVAPYVSAELGWMRELLDDTGGAVTSHRFAVAGLGVELALRDGFSVTTDFEIGPEQVAGRFDERWYLSGWYRLGIGYRF